MVDLDLVCNGQLSNTFSDLTGREKDIGSKISELSRGSHLTCDHLADSFNVQLKTISQFASVGHS